MLRQFIIKTYLISLVKEILKNLTQSTSYMLQMLQSCFFCQLFLKVRGLLLKCCCFLRLSHCGNQSNSEKQLYIDLISYRDRVQTTQKSVSPRVVCAHLHICNLKYLLRRQMAGYQPSSAEFQYLGWSFHVCI